MNNHEKKLYCSVIAIHDAPTLRNLGGPLDKLTWDYTSYSKYKISKKKIDPRQGGVS